MAQKEALYFEGGSIIACTNLAAAYFGVSAQTLSNWKNAGCPRHKYGFYDIKAVTAWRAQQEAGKQAASLDEPELLSPAQQKTLVDAKLKEAQLEAAQLRNQIARGDYLPKSEVVQQTSQLLAALKASLHGLGRELGMLASAHIPPDAARQLEQQIAARISEMLARMASGAMFPDG